MLREEVLMAVAIDVGKENSTRPAPHLDGR
jgi:hypothetical protein